MQPYPGPGGKWQISTLFYRSGDKMMAVDVTTQPRFSSGKPQMLFEGQHVETNLTYPWFDISPDGQRFYGTGH